MKSFIFVGIKDYGFSMKDICGHLKVVDLVLNTCI